MSKEEKKAIERPLVLEMRDAKAEIVGSVNAAIQNRRIPCYLLRGILEEILTSVKEIERTEIAAAEVQYKAAVEEQEGSK